MSIAAPRYAGPTTARVGRGARTLAIFLREFGAVAGPGTYVVVALGYAALLIGIVFDTSFPLPGGITLATFYGPVRGQLWPLLLLLVAAATGAGAIAEDLASRAISLYLSRPIHLADYVLAKSAGIGAWIGILAIGPGVIGTILTAALGNVSFDLALSAIGVFLGVGLLVTFFLTGLALALSAWTGRSLYAGVAIFGLVLSLEFAAQAVSGVTGNPQVRYLGFFLNLQSVLQAAFQTGEAPATDPLLSAIGLALAGAALFVAAWVRLSRVEVAGE